MICLFIAAPHIPLTILTLVIFTMPLFVSILSYPILKERVSVFGYTAAATGFLGIALAVNPISGPLNFYFFIALLGSLFYGLAVLSIRQLGKTEPPGTMFFYFTISCT